MGSLKKHEELPSSESGSAVVVMVFGGWKPPMEESAGQLDLGSACPVLAAANVALESIFVLHRIEGKSTADARGLSSHETMAWWQVMAVRKGSDNNPRGRPQKVHQSSFKMLVDDFITSLRHIVGAGD
ncbi:hypothetical protein J6590_074605 [Homalodisca vitripennis]|nr:hypothetical protein J6590_074605 [Homalodisca vitripennis]